MNPQLIKRLINNNHGLTLTEVMIAITIVSVTVLTAVSFNSLFFTRAVGEFDQQGLLHIRNEINQLLLDDESFAKTVANNPSLSCVQNKGSDCRGQGGRITLYDRHGGEYLFVAQSTSTSSGFSTKNGPCNTFSTAGNAACPLQYALSWQPVCPSTGKCSNPAILLTATLDYKPGANAPEKNLLNPSRYNISLNRSQTHDTFSVTCSQTGGTYSSLEKKCILPARNSSCPVGTFLKGFSKNGEIICIKPVNAGQRCAPLRVVVGIDNTGKVVCAPGCSTPPPADGGGDGDGGF